MGHSARTGRLGHDTSDGDSIRDWAGHSVCSILVKSVPAFCQYPENLCKADPLSIRNVKKESIHSGCVMVLLSALLQLYREKEQKVEQEGIKNVQFSGKNCE